MQAARTPTFIHELKLKTTPQHNKILEKKLNVARLIYNACLGESLKRLKMMRESKLYQQAIKMPQLVKDNKNKMMANKKRTSIFKQARGNYGFREYDIHKYVTNFYSKTWLAEHIDSLTAQKIATRAFSAVEQYCYGKRGKPRFKGKNRFCSIEGKNNTSGLRFIDGKVVCTAKGSPVLVIQPHYDLKDKSGLEANALCCKTKYIRLIRRTIKGDNVWYVQLIQEGVPYTKHNLATTNNTVGLDIGPSSIAVVSDSYASLQAFCPEVDDTKKSMLELQRKMSRSLRAMNPDNFEDNIIVKNKNNKKILKYGKVKKNAKKWHRSKCYLKLQCKLAEQHRKMAATRKCSHGNLINKILRYGNNIKTEKLSYKSFQKSYGKSVGLRAPGLFLEKLRRKAVSAGGVVTEFKTQTTALSQTCHCGAKHKKQLKERWHHCEECGIVAQRDLYSAFLACFVKSNKLDTSQAAKAWVGADILLKQAVSNLNKTATGKCRLASFGLNQRQSGLSAKEESVLSDALDVVACPSGQVRAKESLLPCP